MLCRWATKTFSRFPAHERGNAAYRAGPVSLPATYPRPEAGPSALQYYEDAMIVDAGPAGRTPLPAGDDLMDLQPTKLTSIFEDPAPEPPVPNANPYLV